MTEQPADGAPRLLEWTGERCVPWVDDPPVIYEHFHRYLFAAHLVEGRRVLDLASGEGFGAAFLADRANTVLGIDIDESAVAHARLNYRGPRLDFQVGDARELLSFEGGSFDAVVAFEMLEHVEDQERVLAGIRHVLSPDGLLIVSTPERVAYSEETGFENPYHVRELTLAEFRELLGNYFAQVETWGQRTVTGSLMWRLEDRPEVPAGEDFVIERRDDGWQVVSEISPMYVIAVAGNGALPRGPDGSVLADPGQSLLMRAKAAQAREEELRRGAERNAEEAERRARTDVADMRTQLLRVGDELSNERRRAAELENRVADAERIIAMAHEELAIAQDFRRGVEASGVWQLLQRGRRGVYGALGGRRSPLGNLLERAIRFLTRNALRRMR